MANFTTHIAVGTVVSGALATLTLAANVVPQGSLIAVTLAGVLGSILPDIDLKDSRPSRAMFAGLGIFFSFAVLFTAAGKYSIVELWMLWLGTLLGIRYGLHAIFHRIAVHRGIWHSLLATAFCTLLTAIIFKYILGEADGIAWLGGGFLAIGYLTHLVLDEIYSVDVMDVRLKTSFGTALKFIDIHNWQHSVAMAIGVAGLTMIAPPANQFVEGISSKTMWTNLEQQLLPRDAWFGIVDRKRAVAQSAAEPAAANTAAPAAALASKSAPAVKSAPAASAPAPLVTGSIPNPSPFKTIATDDVKEAPAKPTAR
ncbi:MAG: metal-dependent hydrolase [Hyphomicrobiaceae bacterium]